MPPTCIIVDDHTALRTLLMDWLGESFPNTHFLAASSGEEALEMAQRIKPDVMLMDVGLPGMNGIEVTRKIKQAHPETFIIIHTIHEDLAYRQDAASAGADIYITKSKTQTDLLPILLTVFSSNKQ
jgi:DNA-binding NarL/FixJ family response regulator